MREEHDRRAGFLWRQILLEPIELLGAELAHAFKLEDVVEPDEMHPVVVEAVPSGALGGFAIAFEVELAVVRRGVVFAGDVEHSLLLQAGQELLRRVELGSLCGMRDVAGVDEEVGLAGFGVDAVYRKLQRCSYVSVGRLAESEVGIADLREAEVVAALRA